MSRCNICHRPLNQPDDPLSRDCGGDCRQCMAVVGQDPDIIRAICEEYRTLYRRVYNTPRELTGYACLLCGGYHFNLPCPQSEVTS